MVQYLKPYISDIDIDRVTTNNTVIYVPLANYLS